MYRESINTHQCVQLIYADSKPNKYLLKIHEIEPHFLKQNFLKDLPRDWAKDVAQLVVRI